MTNIAKNLKYFFILPIILSVLAVAALGVWGLKPSIDLVGGSLLQVTYPDGRPTVEQLQSAIEPLGVGEVRIQPAGQSGYILRQRDLTETEHQAVVSALGKLRTVHEDEYTSIGPSLGAELLTKAWIAIVLVVLLIIAFIAFAFRGVSKPVASWKYGVIAIVTLAHDILVPTGLFALLGYTHGAEVDALFIVGLLTILGISINDTIVIFDRIRENLRLNEEHHRHEGFDHVVGKSIRQTIARSINTSLTVVIVLASLYFVGPIATQNFALTLIVGMVAGTYSSIFLAAPLLVVWERLQKRS
jgi:preprotein translocase subunit SecF